jgi:hypothetical protein
LRNAKSGPATATSGGPFSGAVRITDPSTFNCGKSMPMLPQNSRDHAPPASTTDPHAIAPRSVTTQGTRTGCLTTPESCPTTG